VPEFQTNVSVCVAADSELFSPFGRVAGNQCEGAKNRHTNGPQGRQLKKLPGTVYRFTGAEAARKLLESAKGAQVLTVGDDAGFLEAGGILEFAYAGTPFNLPQSGGRKTRGPENRRAVACSCAEGADGKGVDGNLKCCAGETFRSLA